MSRPAPTASDDREQYYEEFTPQASAWIAAVVTVAATYVFFLIFAQFGFLKIVQAHAASGGEMVRSTMVSMCVAGLVGSAWAAWRFVENRSLRRMVLLFAVCGAAAGLSLVAKSAALLFVVALLTGFGLGALTVTLAGILRRVTGGDRLGSVVGLGTGAAYAICNLPFLFNATSQTQAFCALAAACVGILAVQMMELRAPRQVPHSYDYRPPSLVAWVLIFLALVWLDSGAFAVIQQSPQLKELTWGTERLYANAAIHFAAAVLAGYLMDRRWIGRAVLAGAAMLLAACVLIDPASGKLTEGVLLYTAGVSVYSTALVFYPARSCGVEWAAILYGVAGWIGSAGGVVVTENLSVIPRWFVAGAAAALAVGFALRGWWWRRASRGLVAGLAGALLLLAGASAIASGVA